MYNEIKLIGNLGKDPEFRSMEGGKMKCSFSLATTKYYKDKSGEKRQKTTWHNCVAWGQKAEIISRYTKKGSKLFISGEQDHRSFQNAEGETRYISEVIIDDFVFLDSKESNSNHNQQQNQSDFVNPNEGFEGDDQDLPF